MRKFYSVIILEKILQKHKLSTECTDIRVSSDGSKIMMFDGIGNIMTKEMVDRSIYTGSLVVNGLLNAHSSTISKLKVDTITPLSKMVTISGMKIINSSILGLRRYMITPKLSFRAVSSWDIRETTNPISSICWSPELGLLCGVSTDIVQTSKDARTWISISIEGKWKFINWSGEKEMFVVSGGSGGSGGTGDFMYSHDGETWTTSKLDVQEIKAMCHSQELGKFCILENEGSMVSDDGMEWEIGSMNFSMMSGICWSNDLELFCCIGSSSLLSSDGINWTPPFVLSETYNSVVWANDLYLFCAVGNNVISISDDGKSWTTCLSPSNTNWTKVTWSPEIHLIVVVGNSCIGYSYDGVSWYSVNVPQGSNWNSICWSKELGIFVVSSNETNKIMVSRYVKKF